MRSPFREEQSSPSVADSSRKELHSRLERARMRCFNPLPGGHSGVVPPDSIPNSEVKRACADGSVALPCKSRSPPGALSQKASPFRGGFRLCGGCVAAAGCGLQQVTARALHRNAPAGNGGAFSFYGLLQSKVVVSSSQWVAELGLELRGEIGVGEMLVLGARAGELQGTHERGDAADGGPGFTAQQTENNPGPVGVAATGGIDGRGFTGGGD